MTSAAPRARSVTSIAHLTSHGDGEARRGELRPLWTAWWQARRGGETDGALDYRHRSRCLSGGGHFSPAACHVGSSFLALLVGPSFRGRSPLDAHAWAAAERTDTHIPEYLTDDKCRLVVMPHPSPRPDAGPEWMSIVSTTSAGAPKILS